MIVVRIYEGLGNQMFEYAYAYALNERAKRQGIKVYLDLRDTAETVSDRARFARTLDIKQFDIRLPAAPPQILSHWDYLSRETAFHRAACRLAEHRLYRYGIHEEYRYQHQYHYNYTKDHFRIRDNTYITGWYQHEEYFATYRQALLKEFSLKKAWKIPVPLKQILKENEVISLHIRRGDYITNPTVRKIMHICDQEYYRKAVEYIRKRLDHPYLLVFTNDVEWVRKNFHSDLPMMIVSETFELTDAHELLLMSCCNHNIISNSTYSWWGAWLNTHKDKIVIAPQKWFVDPQRKNIAAKQWIRL